MAFTIELRQGTTLIATRTQALTNSLATYEFTLTPAERALVTNWSTLRYYLKADAEQVAVSWAEFEVPGSGAQGLAAGVATVTGRSATFLGLQSAVGSAAGVATALAGQLYRAVATGLGTVVGVSASVKSGTGLSSGSSAATAPSTLGTVTAAIGRVTASSTTTGTALLGPVVGINSAVGNSSAHAYVAGWSLMGNFLFINDQQEIYLTEGCSIQETYAGNNTLTCSIGWPTSPVEDPNQSPVTAGPPFRRGDEVILIENGTRIFGGVLDTVRMRGWGGETWNEAIYDISCIDFKVYAEKRFVIDGGFPAGYTTQNAFALLTTYLYPFQVTVSPDIEQGPLLPELVYDVRSIRSCYDEIAEITNRIWNIDYYKTASINSPGYLLAPFNVGIRGASFFGTKNRYLIQQAEYARYLQPGDPRLTTTLSALTLSAYNAVMANINGQLDAIIAAMPSDSRASFDNAYSIECNSGRFGVPFGTPRQFLINQAELYQYAPQGDPRLKTFFYAATLTAYEAAIATVDSGLTSIYDGSLTVNEKNAFNQAYNQATLAGRASREIVGDVEVEPAQHDYANKVIVRYGQGIKDIQEDLAGDGVTTVWQVGARVSKHYGIVHTYRNGVISGGETLSVAPDLGGQWLLDLATSVLTRQIGPTEVGVLYRFVYTVQFPQTAIAMDLDELQERPIEEVVLSYPDIFNPDTAQQLAQSLLPRYVDLPRTVHYTTYSAGIHPGMLQSITVPARNFYDKTCFISDVTITATETGFIREVSALEGVYIAGSWRDYYRNLGSGGGSTGSGGGSISTGGGTGGEVPPYLPPVPGGSGPTIGGSGTAGRHALFTTPTLLAASIIAESGSVVTIPGTVNVTGTIDVIGTLDADTITSRGITVAGTIAVNGAITVSGTITATTYAGTWAGQVIAPAYGGTGLNTSASSGVMSVNAGTWVVNNVLTANRVLLAAAGNTVTTSTGLTYAGSVLTVDASITAPANLTVTPAGDLVLDPVGNDVLPATNYDINLGMLTKKYLTLHAAELWVETLVAQNTIATIGGRILVLPTNILTSDLTAVATTMLVKYNNLAVGDRLYMEAAGLIEFFAVTAGPTGSGPYSYTVTRDLDGTGANTWAAGDAVANTGQAGNGFIDLYSVRGVKAGTEIGPTIVGNVRLSGTFNDWVPRWAIGNLNGLYGYGADTYGAAFGNPSASNIVIDGANGIRIRSGTTNKFAADTAGNLSLTGDLTIGTAGVFRTAGATNLTTGTGIYMAGGASPVFRIGDPTAGSAKQIVWNGSTNTLTVGLFTVDATNFTAPEVNINASGLMTIGSTGTSDICMSMVAAGGIRFWIGSIGSPTTSAFRVDSGGGMLTASLTLGGTMSLGTAAIITPPTITADQNDYNPTGILTARVLRLASDATRTITGITALAGRCLMLTNGGSNSIQLPAESTSSAAANRFVTPGLVTFTLHTGDSIDMYYSANRWILVGY